MCNLVLSSFNLQKQFIFACFNFLILLWVVGCDFELHILRMSSLLGQQNHIILEMNDLFEIQI